MIYVKGHNIYTGLGFGSEAVYSRLRKGETDLQRCEGVFGVPDSFVASLLDRDEIALRYGSHPDAALLTPLEKAMILSAEDAIARSGIDAADPRTIFVLSSTKGNVDQLESSPEGEDERLHLWHSAGLLASHFANPNDPICVTNACTSGICAQITAQRLIEASGYANAVVVGADFLSKFVIAGFQSLKALSPERCRPFDRDRMGLNLSEAVSTLVFSSDPLGASVALEDGCIRNDANHISAPSRTGVGQVAAIRRVVSNDIARDLAFINLHGTATAYNDNMESVSLHTTRLDDVPAVSYKSVLGHTLGAAGILETVVSCLALLEGTVFPTAGYRNCGVDFPLNLADEFRSVRKGRFLKIMSGFGGINAATLYKKI